MNPYIKDKGKTARGFEEMMKDLHERQINFKVIREYDKFFADCSYLVGGYKGNFPEHDRLIIGPRGTGKTEWFKERVARLQVELFKGLVKPVEVHARIFSTSCPVVVFDDTKDYFKNPQGLEQLLCLTETGQPKRMQWDSNFGKIRDNKVYNKDIRCAILTNDLPHNSPTFDALLDRMSVTFFLPYVAAIHQYAGTFWQTLPEDKEVYDFIGTQIPILTHLSCRMYGDCKDDKNGPDGKEWKLNFIERVKGENPLAWIAGEILSNETDLQKQLEMWEKRTVGFGKKKESASPQRFHQLKRQWKDAHGKEGGVNIKKVDVVNTSTLLPNSMIEGLKAKGIIDIEGLTPTRAQEILNGK